MRKDSRLLAKAILHDRSARRKLMLQFLMVLVAGVAIGTWLLNSWIDDSVLLFLCYWSAILLGVVMLILLCIYDMLMAFRGK